MVTPDCLAAVDYLFWLRTGARAAEALHCNQSTISRHSQQLQDLFQVSFRKQAAEWRAEGDDALLTAERAVHQAFRWQRGLPLRLDAQHWMRERLQSLPLEGWVKGNLNYLEYGQPLYLLKARILDAWLCSAPDHPSDDPQLCTFQLCSMPALFVVKQDHPLLQVSDLSLEAVRRYPLLPLPRGAFPVFEAMLAAMGIGAASSCEVTPHHPGMTLEDLLVGITSPLTLHLYGPSWRVLPLKLPLNMGDVLVVPAEFAGHPRTHQLLARVSDQLRDQCADHPDVTLSLGFEAVPGGGNPR